MSAETRLLADAVLIERIAALGDKNALRELDARHGMTLFAIAYTVLLDPDAADAAVAAALRQVWRDAASFDARLGTAGTWLAELTRRAAREHLNALRRERLRPAVARSVAARPRPSRPPRRPYRRRVARRVRVALARAFRFAAALALPTLLVR